MKKNLVFKLGLFCAALVLVATCFVTNAWAKYTKTVSATDSARVARFSVTTTMGQADEEITVANQEIKIFDTAFVNIYGDDDQNGAKLIAPGSHGSFDIVLTNTSEVAVRYDLSATDTNAGSIPIKWTCGTTTKDSLADLLAAIGPCIIAETDGSTPSDRSFTISWSWAYHVDDDGDEYDTTLGEKATLDTYTVVIECVATQVQPA